MEFHRTSFLTRKSSVRRWSLALVGLLLLGSFSIAAVRSENWRTISTRLSASFRSSNEISEEAKQSINSRPVPAMVTESRRGNIIPGTIPLFGAATTDFHQSANKKDAPHDVDWINGILNKNNSKYYEGTSTLQRLIYTGITATAGNSHTLTFSHNAVKGSAHAYDYLTSWKQAVDAANAIAPGQNLLTNLNFCGSAISANAATACSSLHVVGPLDAPNGTTVVDVIAPDNMGSILSDDVAASVTGYETRFGNRTIRIYGNQNITLTSLTFDGYVADDATYTLTWTSASDQLIIEFATHIAQGTDTLNAGIGYGAGKGASSINGGPYHVHLGNFDGSGGNLDNQIQGSDVCDVALSATVTTVSCFGGSNGAISLTVTGGTAPITYLWNDGNTSQNRTGLTAGTYSVTATDKNGCTAALSNIVVGQPTALTATATPTNVSCNSGNDGAISINVSGGTPSYSFLWNDGNTTQNRTGLSTGTYSVTVTDSKGCTTTVNGILVGQPPALAVTSSVKNVSCNGGSDGEIALSVSGGTSPYSFKWSDGSTDQNRTGLKAGIYSVMITDATGCAVSQGFTITQPDALALSETHTNVLCNGGTDGAIDLSVTGGTAPYTYLWSNGTTTQDLSVIPAGTYSVTVTDAKGCTANKSVTITQPDALALSETHTNVGCNGDSSGAIDLSVTGGTAPYSYEWSNSATTEDLSGLAAGSYSVKVTDANGCTANKSVTITQPDALALSEKHTNVLCNGDSSGAIDLTVSGGTAPYSYAWSNGETTEDLSGIPAGTYSVKVTDANGCMAELNNVQITQPDALALSETHKNVLCNGDSSGAIDLTVTGGTAPYSYAWSNGDTSEDLNGIPAGTYSVKVTDANGCMAELNNVQITQPDPLNPQVKADGPTSFCTGGKVTLTADSGFASYQWCKDGEDIDGATGASYTADKSGDYIVKVTNADGCKGTSAETTVTVNPLPEITVSPDQKLTCKVTKVELSSDAPNIKNPKYEWTTADGHIVGPADTNKVEVDMAGTYKVTVTDMDTGCSASKEVKVTEDKTPPDVDAGADATIDCATGQVKLTGTSTVANATYLWETSDGNIVSGGDTATPTVDKPGTYTLTVTNPDNGCQATDTVKVSPCLTEFCSLTQGAYGNGGGKYWYNGDQYGTLPLIQELLKSGSLVVGKGGRSLTIPLAAAECIIKRLPAGGPAAALPNFGDAMLDATSCQTPTALPLDSKNIKWRNVLLGQTVALSLNVRLDKNLAGLSLCGKLVTAKALPGDDGKLGTADDKPEPAGPDLNLDGIPDNYLVVTIPAAVLTALQNLGLPQTVDGIRELANRALAGDTSLGGASLSDINAAVDAINRGFDACRFLIECKN